MANPNSDIGNILNSGDTSNVLDSGNSFLEIDGALKKAGLDDLMDILARTSLGRITVTDISSGINLQGSAFGAANPDKTVFDGGFNKPKQTDIQY